MNNLTTAFENGKAFIPLIVCGYPNIEVTENIIRSTYKNGADMIEFLIPFSDPTAEGPLLQNASIEALKTGVTTDIIFDMFAKLQTDIKIPFIFRTYANVIFSYGSEKFISLCKDCGVCGLIISDLPYEEKEEFLSICKKYEITIISTVSHSSNERIEKICTDAEGFIYVISDTTANAVKTIEKVRKYTKLPCVVNIDNDSITDLHTFDGIIINNAIINLIKEHNEASVERISEFIHTSKINLK